MAQQTINLGTPDKGNGDPLRVAFAKVNANFNELYSTEISQDYVAQMLVNGNHEGATVEYDDATNKLNIIVAQDYDGGAASTVFDNSITLDGGGA